MYRTISAVFAVAFIFALTQEGYSLRCYRCIAPINGSCDAPFNSTHLDQIGNCTDNENVCYVQAQVHTSPVMVVRGCGLQTVCDDLANVTPNATTNCKTCTNDLCNTDVVKADGKVPGVGSIVKPFLVLNAAFVFLLAYKL